MGYERIEVRPIAGALGAEIVGADLTRPLDNRVTEEIHQAFRQYLVIFFREQALTPESFKAFGQLFGTFGPSPFVKTMDGHSEIMEVVRDVQPANPKVNFGGAWHSDMSFAREPAKATMLHAKEVPSHGGDTLYTNMYLAYDALSDGMKKLLGGLKAVHCAARHYGPKGTIVTDEDTREMVIRSAPEALAEREHPAVRTHPETGRKCLFVNPTYTTRFASMTKAESAPLLKFLFEHSIRPEFTCRFRWQQNSLAVWDNRCTMHFAINDYLGFRRVMHRITIAGDRPV